ncbi:MAG: ribosome assembly RNA-binding protein YhbY [Gammaproteobacteria bacterium]|nr:ribosome assembly RNA-binding protein YhbY [Gammaproteobacteria bacterium]
MDPRTRKQLRQIAHHLDPVVSVGDHGLSESVLAEANRALNDHELIKVRIHAADRQQRAALGDELALRCSAEVVQKIGKIFVLFKSNPEPNQALSNLSRYG